MNPLEQLRERIAGENHRWGPWRSNKWGIRVRHCSRCDSLQIKTPGKPTKTYVGEWNLRCQPAERKRKDTE